MGRQWGDVVGDGLGQTDLNLSLGLLLTGRVPAYFHVNGVAQCLVVKMRVHMLTCLLSF